MQIFILDEKPDKYDFIKWNLLTLNLVSLTAQRTKNLVVS